jgi:hybrid cluster-associated redox disulfide protein
MPRTTESTELFQISVGDLLDAWPSTASALLGLRVGCVGCQLAAFHTLADVARIYGLQAERLVGGVERAIASSSSETPASPNKTRRC